MRPFIYFILLLLSACTTLTPKLQQQDLAWSTRLQQLQRINHWTIQGSVGVRTTERAWSASLFWQQTPKNYALHLFGPLGVNRIQLAGTRNQVTLTSPVQPTVSAKNAEALLQQQLGWQLPVKYLTYWIRGIPAPGQPAQLAWDEVQHLSKLNQAGWEITYTAYSNIAGVDLPTRITLQHTNLQLRLVIHQWQL